MAKSHKASLLALRNNIIPLDFKNNTLMCNFDYTADSINGIKPFGIHIDNTTVAYYDFQPYPDSSKLYDKSPGCNHGTINGCTLTGGINGYAYNFDGTDDYINIGNSSNFDFTGPFSISMHLKTSTADAVTRTIISKCGGVMSDTPFCVDINSGKLRFFSSTSGGLYGITDSSSYTSIADGNWHNIVCVYDGTNWTIYVDGSQYASVSQPATITTNNANVLIGYRLNVNNYFQGQIAKLAIYNRALTQEEVFRHSKESIYQLTGMDYQLEYLPIRYIRNWLNGNTVNANNHWVEIQAIDTNNTNIASGKTVTGSVAEKSGFPYTRVTDNDTTSANYAESNNTGQQYVLIDLGQVYNTIKQIKVWHYYGDARKYHNNIIEVSEDGKVWHKLFDSNIHGEYTETSSGFIVNVPSILKRRGKFGGALVIGEKTDNMLSTYFFDCDFEKTSFENSSWKVSVVNDPEATNGKCVEIEAKQDMVDWPIAINLSDEVPFTDNSTDFTLTIRYKVLYCDDNPSGTYAHNQIAIWSHWHRIGDTNIPSDYVFHSGTVTSPTNWIVKSFTQTSPSANTKGKHFYLGTGSVKAGTKYRVDYVQFEKKSYSSYFINGSRNNSSFYLPIEVLNKDEGTISFWIKYDRIPSAVLSIISNNSNETGYAFDILFGLESGSQKFYFRKYKGPGNSNQASYVVTNTVLNRWVHVAATWKNGDVLKLYIDGQLVSTSPSGVDMSVLGSVLVIGHSPGLGRSAPNFMMDELRIDSIRRTDDEILQWYATQYHFYYDNPIKVVAQ